jgi:galactokinase
MSQAAFQERFGDEPGMTASAPARVNLIGEWVDFNGGLVLPAALPIGVEIAVGEGGDQDEIASGHFDGAARFALDAPAAGHWSDYVRGALQHGRREGWISGGRRVFVSSDMPAGAGLSSSAAVIVATLLALRGPVSEAERVESAVQARAIENEYIGVPCGIMDQMAVALARPGQALALDTGDLSYRRLAIPEGWRFSVVHSGVDRALADGAYAERRAACQTACEALGVSQLCGLDPERADSLPAELAPIARHVIREDARARRAAEHLAAAEFDAFGALMEESHASLRDDFRVSTPEVDALVADALVAGAAGARITGAGFGGCIVALTRAEEAEAWWAAVSRRHPRAWRVD